MSDTATVLKIKKDLNSAISEGRNEEAKDILNKLKTDVTATEALVRDTKIGLAVGKLRQNADKGIASLAKELVKKWKDEVGPTRSKSGSAVPTLASTPGSGKEKASPSQSPAPASSKPSPSPALSTHDRKPSFSTSNGASAGSPAASTSASAIQGSSSTSAVKKEGGEAGKPRNTKTDGVNTSVTEDKTRNKCVELVYDALANDSDAPSELILTRAKEIEFYTFSALDLSAYRGKMRSLVLNLKDKNNPSLRGRIISGELATNTLHTLSPADLASEEKKAELQAYAKDALFSAQGAAPKKAETDMFECGKCKKRRTTYYQMQTRSADEPMTTFVTCLNCGHNWRFS